MRRRDFLRASGLAAGGALLGCEPTDSVDPLTPADQPWGLVDRAEQGPGLLPENLRPEGIFEMYLYGGIRPWDAFYSVPEFGDPGGSGPYPGGFGHLFTEGGEEPMDEWLGLSGAGDRPWDIPFAADGNGRMVHMGPWIWPLHDRPDILERMRVVVMRHGDQPHQTAVPLALSGHALGNPRRAGTAAHVQRYFGWSGDPGRSWGASILPYHGPELLDNVDSAATSGLHPASARPLTFVLLEAARSAERLRRVALSPNSASRAELLDWYRRRMDRRFARVGEPSRVRARLLNDYATARAARAGAPWLAELLDEPFFQVNQPISCGVQAPHDYPRMALDLGVRLLNDPVQPSKYVVSTDLAIEAATGGSGYDTHERHVAETAINLPWVMQHFVDRINRPGETDPNKFDLDRHMLVISTEMGRTPYAEGEAGTDHWPQGYAQILIGGPIGPEQAGVAGAIEPDGYASDWFSPAEFRAALLIAQGIWPFNAEAFAVSDVRGAQSELEAALRLRGALLGHPA